MKKVYIKEESINALNKQRLLPKFLFKAVKNHVTSLGDNEAFPNGGEYPFDYTVLKKRYNEVCDSIESLNLESLEEDYLMTLLSKLIKECKDLEKPIRHELERICENALNRLFAIPKEIVNMEFRLVDKVTFKGAVRVTPENDEDVKYSFKDINDIEHSNKVVEKRRFINALIQGAAYTYARNEELYADDINAINSSLLPLYEQVNIINDYLLFTKKEELSDDKPMQGSYAETHIGMQEEKSSIEVQGIIFPLLFQESIKGLFDLFSAHGLPSDKQKAQYIIKKADYILAEPWDMRLGVGIWNQLFGDIEDTNAVPYVFVEYVKLPTDEFNVSTKEILSNTERGNEILSSMIDKATYDSGYNAFQNRINAKNVNKAVINDSYFTASELDGFNLDGEEDGDVIEEDDIDEGGVYQSFGVSNEGVETWYRGICGSFNEELNQRQIWLADTPEYAAGYAGECEEDGHLYAFDVDMSKFNEYDWWEDEYFEPIDGFSEEEQKELVEQGYNGYTFALDEGTVLVLFDPSLIVNVRELPLNEYLEESNKKDADLITESQESKNKSKTILVSENQLRLLKEESDSSFNEILLNSTVDSIDFIEGNVGNYGEEVVLSVDGVEIPRELVSLDFRPIEKRFPKGKQQMLNIDIELEPSLREQGLGTKIYAKAVREFGAICSQHSTRHNDDGIRGIFNNLNSFDDIMVFQDTYNNIENETICDYYAILNSQLDIYI